MALLPLPCYWNNPFSWRFNWQIIMWLDLPLWFFTRNPLQNPNAKIRVAQVDSGNQIPNPIFPGFLFSL